MTSVFELALGYALLSISLGKFLFAHLNGAYLKYEWCDVASIVINPEMVRTYTKLEVPNAAAMGSTATVNLRDNLISQSCLYFGFSDVSRPVIMT